MWKGWLLTAIGEDGAVVGWVEGGEREDILLCRSRRVVKGVLLPGRNGDAGRGRTSWLGESAVAVERDKGSLALSL